MIQEVNKGVWIDETGREIPVKYINKSDKLKERYLGRISKRAEKLHNDLFEFKAEVSKLGQEVYDKAMEDFKVSGNGKGNYTLYNFDRSIRLETSINELITFDDLAIKASKEHLDVFFSENLDPKVEFIADLVKDAFSTTKGKLDTKKVMSLLKYKSKIKHESFQKSMVCLEEGIRRPSSKTYYRIAVRLDDGSYKNIDLNFSSI